MASIRKCIICGKSYEYCPNCAQKSKTNERWKMLYCNEDCKDISDVINKYGHGHITELEAQEMLSSYDLNDRDNYVDNIKKVLDKIFSVQKEPKVSFKKKKSKKENIVNDDLITIAIDKDKVEDASITNVDDDSFSIIEPIVID